MTEEAIAEALALEGPFRESFWLEVGEIAITFYCRRCVLGFIQHHTPYKGIATHPWNAEAMSAILQEHIDDHDRKECFA